MIIVFIKILRVKFCLIFNERLDVRNEPTDSIPLDQEPTAVHVNLLPRSRESGAFNMPRLSARMYYICNFNNIFFTVSKIEQVPALFKVL